jgi:threonine aldolase
MVQVKNMKQRSYIMLYFENDYCEGAHEAILKRLMETNMEKVPGYGQDPFCDKAKEKIKEACGCPDGEVYFLVGGTQTNAVVIASVLNRYEGVLSAVTGHVNAHEAGAIEFTGHKLDKERSRRMTMNAEQQYIELFSQTEAMITWFFQAWFIFHIRQNTELFTQSRNWQIFPVYAGNMRSRYFWTEPDWAMDWWQRQM